MIYSNAIVVQTGQNDDQNACNKLFEDIDLKSIGVRDNGILKLEGGSVINKKFKYFNNND